jgi:hypothetical protein
MSRILRRPMFRGGPVDSRGTGITSGLMDGGRVGFDNGGSPFLRTPVSMSGGQITESQKSKPYLDINKFNYNAGLPFAFEKATPLNIDKKTYVPGVVDESQEEEVETTSIEDILKNKALEYGSQDSTKKTDVTIEDKIESYKPSAAESGSLADIINKQVAKIATQADNTYQDDNGIKRDRVTGEIIESKGRDLEENAKLSQAAYEANILEKAKIPNINLERPEEPEITAKDAVRANQELFADLLGKSKARGLDLSDMLASASASFLGTGGVKEGFAEFMANQAKAGPSRTEKINEAAAALAIQDYAAGKRAKEQAEIYKGKIDYEYVKKGELANVQMDDNVQTALFKFGKLLDVSPKSDSAIISLIGMKKNTDQVYREDKVKMKDLGSTSKIKKLKPGYNIIEEDGVKNIVVYDGLGDPSTIQVFSIEQIWNS